MVLAQINELKLRQALLNTAIFYLEKHPLIEDKLSRPINAWVNKISDLFDFGNTPLVMCRVAKMAQDENLDKSALAVVACVLFQRYRTDMEVTLPLMKQFMQNNPFNNDLLEIMAKTHIQHENLATRHRFDLYERHTVTTSHYFCAFLSLFTIAAEENDKAFDAAVINYLQSDDITEHLNLPKVKH